MTAQKTTKKAARKTTKSSGTKTSSKKATRKPRKFLERMVPVSRLARLEYPIQDFAEFETKYRALGHGSHGFSEAELEAHRQFQKDRDSDALAAALGKTVTTAYKRFGEATAAKLL